MGIANEFERQLNLHERELTAIGAKMVSAKSASTDADTPLIANLSVGKTLLSSWTTLVLIRLSLLRQTEVIHGPIVCQRGWRWQGISRQL